ncbi:MAG: hypothetical protein DMF95_12740 [Acidobacteria bacterium]|nr:MAG: hypothetical protein DMF96_09165 [Acidobacteriota bacterium]PYR16390.1 MAG: hypothetical protein DMF94_28205 [Acidobacteriota bacterium]PYR49165.1 MAG: hypothetical protein DMF95_12740 [Acidobacteriota bacterium]
MDQHSAVLSDTNDVVSSTGVFNALGGRAVRGPWAQSARALIAPGFPIENIERFFEGRTGTASRELGRGESERASLLIFISGTVFAILTVVFVRSAHRNLTVRG